MAMVSACCWNSFGHFGLFESFEIADWNSSGQFGPFESVGASVGWNLFGVWVVPLGWPSWQVVGWTFLS